MPKKSSPSRWTAEKLDQKLEPVLRKMEKAGVMINVEFLNKLDWNYEAALQKLSKDIYREAGQEFNINSPAQLAEILFEKLHLPTEELAHTKTGISTAASELQKIATLNPIIPLILEYRQIEKLRNTYVAVLPRLADKNYRVHTTYSQDTSTGRLASANPNLQNIPVRTERGTEIRKAFIAPPGFRLLSADYSQIELRIAASISGDERMVETFAAKEDIHRRTAAEILGKNADEITKSERRDAKAVNFGILYGISVHGLSQGTGLSWEEAKRYIDTYFNIHPGIKKYIQETIKKTREQGYTETLIGRRRNLPEINSQITNVRLAAERMAINAPIQGTAADIIKMAMIKIDKELPRISPRSKMLLQVHDELIFEVPTKEIKKVAKLVKNLMENIYKLEVPLEVNLEAGKSWGDLKPFNKEKSK